LPIHRLVHRRVCCCRPEPPRSSMDSRHSYVRWALDDPAVARLAFGAGRAEPATPISPHPHDVLVAELDRLVDHGALTASVRPGAEFIVWLALHGLATLLTDGLIHLDNPRDVDRQAERLVQAVLTGLAHETSPSPTWPAPRSPHTERLARSQTCHSAPDRSSKRAPSPSPARP